MWDEEWLLGHMQWWVDLTPSEWHSGCSHIQLPSSWSPQEESIGISVWQRIVWRWVTESSWFLSGIQTANSTWYPVERMVLVNPAFATGKSRDVAENSTRMGYWVILILVWNPNCQLDMISSRGNGADEPCLDCSRHHSSNYDRRLAKKLQEGCVDVNCTILSEK